MDIQEYVNGLEIHDAPKTKGYYAIVEYDGQYYYASMADLLRFYETVSQDASEAERLISEYSRLVGARYEFMVFRCDENGALASWEDLYSSRWNELSKEIFRQEVCSFLELVATEKSK